mgnify:CR=1 FL=1
MWWKSHSIIGILDWVASVLRMVIVYFQWVSSMVIATLLTSTESFLWGTSIEVESHLLNYRLADFIVGMLDLVVWMLMMGLEGSLTVPDL